MRFTKKFMKNSAYDNNREEIVNLRKDVINKYNRYNKNQNILINFTKTTIIIIIIQIITEIMLKLNKNEIQLYWIIRVILIINIILLYIIKSVSFNIFKRSVDKYMKCIEEFGDPEMKIVSKIIDDVLNCRR